MPVLTPPGAVEGERGLTLTLYGARAAVGSCCIFLVETHLERPHRLKRETVKAAGFLAVGGPGAKG